ncbi:MAG: hypothetical protein J5798_01915 [Spirochaetaceae bacterium]|nr:hypothetical protein [Spirochaetaceae bacterium]MBO4728700.1 hypothetical protein [Spirochaetaceae bacterium]
MTYDEYIEKSHRAGQIWIWSAVCVILFVPVAICLYYDAWPSLGAVLKGLLGVAPIYWTVGIIEIITFTPMLGTGGTYLSFVTGNVTALKVPAALNAMESAGVKSNSEEGEIISTIAIATASIVTTLIIAAGIFLFVPLQPLLGSAKLKPAFDNIMPSLFGGLGTVYISRNWKVSVAPVLFMVVLFVAVPSLASSVGVLVPVGILIALAASRIMYKKGIL